MPRHLKRTVANANNEYNRDFQLAKKLFSESIIELSSLPSINATPPLRGRIEPQGLY